MTADFFPTLGNVLAALGPDKSTLRVAIDEVMRAGHSGVTYWPSFEIVRWLGGHLGMSMFGEDGNTRHVNRAAVRMILNMRYYYRGAAPA